MDLGKVVQFVAALVLAMALATVLMIYNAWWFKFIWDWFAIPLGAPAMTVKQLAMGVAVVAFPLGLSLTSLAAKLNNITTNPVKDLTSIMTFGLLYAPVAVGVAWCFKVFFL